MARKPRPVFSGTALKERRLDDELTLQTCSRIADVTISTWFNWENGSTPSANYLPGIMEALDIDDVWTLYAVPQT